jgi:hypothetical protein
MFCFSLAKKLFPMDRNYKEHANFASGVVSVITAKNKQNPLKRERVKHHETCF